MDSIVAETCQTDSCRDEMANTQFAAQPQPKANAVNFDRNRALAIEQ